VVIGLLQIDTCRIEESVIISVYVEITQIQFSSKAHPVCFVQVCHLATVENSLGPHELFDETKLLTCRDMLLGRRFLYVEYPQRRIIARHSDLLLPVLPVRSPDDLIDGLSR
jgi:hypothetical protein